MALLYIPSTFPAREPDPLVYFVKADRDVPDSLIKIGFSTNLPLRLETFKTTTPRHDLLGCTPGGIQTERALHKFFAPYRQAGEWFTPSPIITTVARYCSDTGHLPDYLAAYVTAFNVRREAEAAEKAAMSLASTALNRFRYKDHGEETVSLVEAEHKRFARQAHPTPPHLA